MHDFLSVTILAVLQGVAEFLPVSSSGHLVIGQHFLGLEAPGMRLDVFLHVGTLASIFAFYRLRIAAVFGGAFSGNDARRRDSWRYAIKIAVSALPAVAVYLLFHERIDALFENAKMVGALLMFTGAVVGGTRLLPSGTAEVGFLRALSMGAAQALALLPGVSRSGMTLVAARMGRVDASKAAEFSFLMSAPLIAGAAALELMKSEGAGDGQLGWPLVIWGAAVASLVGYISLALLERALKGRWFWLFGPYCILAGLLTLWFA